MFVYFYFELNDYSQALLPEQKHDSVNEIGRYPVVTNYFISMNKSVGRDPSGRIPQHELERIFHGLLPAFGHNRVPSDRVQVVLRQIVNRNTIGAIRKKIN